MLSKIKEVFLFSLPLIAGQIGQMMFGMGDLMVAGRYSSNMVAALGIANGLFSPFFMVCLGITFAVAPITARYNGEGKADHSLLSSSLLAALLISIFGHIGVEIVIAHIDYFKINPELVPDVVTYLRICLPSIYGAIIFQVCKEYLQAHMKTYFSNGLILVMNIFNIILNYCLIFGKFGLPPLGIKGIAIATLITRTSMGLILLFYVVKKYGISLPSKQEIKEVFSLGSPIAASVLIEVMVFATVTTLIGRMSPLTSAAHNIALNLASLTFMVPLAVSSAAGTYVGLHFGKKDLHELMIYARTCLIISLSFMMLTASLYFLIPQFLFKVFTNDMELIIHGSSLLFIVGMFQIPDGAQVTLQGILRGMGVTKVPAMMAFISNWMIGLPIGYYLAFSKGLNAQGLWSGLAIGLTMMAISVAFLYQKKKIEFKSLIKLGNNTQ